MNFFYVYSYRQWDQTKTAVDGTDSFIFGVTTFFNLILKIYLFKFNENFFHACYSIFKKTVQLGYTFLTVYN